MSEKWEYLGGLLGRMSLAEKVGQMNLLVGGMAVTGDGVAGGLEEKVAAGGCGAVFNVFTAVETRRLQELAVAGGGVPLMFGYDVIHGHRTIFPLPVGLACSWNLGLIERCARAAACEAAADGLHWVFSPMVDVAQDARWGRVAEGAGEDPWLGARVAAAMVRGYQGERLDAPDAVAACVKHFALYGAAVAGRDYHTVDMSRRAMEETYFPPYRAAVDAGVATVMASFNEVDGRPATGNRWLLTEVLRERWGFGGWVVSDYTALGEMCCHGTAADLADAARQALSAGLDMDMVSEGFANELPELVRRGLASEEQIDAAVMRILSTKWDLGLFADPFARCDPARAARTLLNPEMRALAREAAREAIVLLQNSTGLLPLRVEELAGAGAGAGARLGKVAVIGPLAASGRDMLGCWIAAGRADEAVSVLDGIRALVGGGHVAHAAGCAVEARDECMLAEAVEVARAAAVVVLVLGEGWHMHGEAASRTDIRLPRCQRELARAVAATGTPCVLVTLSGRPLDLSWEAEVFPSLVHAWTLGSEGGHALAEVLFGVAAPVGKLVIGFPRHVGQLPMTYREKPGGRPFVAGATFTSRYIDCPNTPLFPFGHGLTYGELECGEPRVVPETMAPGGAVEVLVEVSNRGGAMVTETLQLYLRDVVASVTRPVMELRGFERVTLEPGETRTVAFTVTEADLAFPGEDLELVVEPGEFWAMVGTNSANTQKARFWRR